MSDSICRNHFFFVSKQTYICRNKTCITRFTNVLLFCVLYSVESDNLVNLFFFFVKLSCGTKGLIWYAGSNFVVCFFFFYVDDNVVIHWQLIFFALFSYVMSRCEELILYEVKLSIMFHLIVETKFKRSLSI